MRSWCRHRKGHSGLVGPALRTEAGFVGHRWLGFGGLQEAVFVVRVPGSVKP